MRRALSRPLRTAVAVWFVLRAAARVYWHESRSELPELIGRLKRVPRARFGADGRTCDGVLERLLPVLPPFGAGRCVKRSLTQLDLCARRGLEPTLHVGFSGGGASRHGHVWVTTRDTPIPEDTAEAWSG